jgi:aspartate racemase
MIPGMIGILAGMGPHSTGPFLALVIAECQRQYGARDDIDFPRIMIHSIPTPFFADRPIDHVAMERAIKKGLHTLAATGANPMAMACNTAQVYYAQLAKSIDVPLLNMVELTIKGIPPSVRKVGLIGSQPTVDSGIYQRSMGQKGVVAIDLSWQPRVNELIDSVRVAEDRPLQKRRWGELLQVAKDSGAEAVVIACLDLSLAGRDVEC